MKTLLLVEEIPNNHLGCIKPRKWWDKLPTSTGAGFLPATVSFLFPEGFSPLRATTSRLVGRRLGQTVDGGGVSHLWRSHRLGFVRWFFVWNYSPSNCQFGTICLPNVLFVFSKSNSFELHLLGQWLNFKLFGITYLVGKMSRSNFFFQGPGRLSECIWWSPKMVGDGSFSGKCWFPFHLLSRRQKNILMRHLIWKNLTTLSRWWFQIYFLFSSLFGEMIQFDEHIFQMGWFNHQLVIFSWPFGLLLGPSFGPNNYSLNLNKFYQSLVPSILLMVQKSQTTTWDL